MKSKKLVIFMVLMLAVSTLLMACGEKDKDKKSGTKQSNTGKVEGDLAAEQVLNLVDSAEIPSMDPSLATDQVSFLVMNNTMEGLYRLGEKDEIQPGVANQDPKVSEDGLTWEIELREDSKWNNGDKVTAEDFVYAWQRAVDPATAAEYAYMLYDIKNAEKINSGELPITDLGVEAVDETHLKIELEHPTPYFQSLLSFATFYPQQKKFVEAQGSAYGTEFDKVMYNGPFVLTGWEHEVGWTYKKNEKYWDKEKVNLTQINVKVVKDINTPVNLYLNGDIQRAGLVSEQVAAHQDRPDFNTSKDTSVYFIRFNQTNTANPILKDVEARKAINMAIDKKDFAEGLLNNGSVAADYLVPSEFLYMDGVDFREANGNMNTYSIKKAQEHWTKAKKNAGVESVTLKLLNFDSEIGKKTGEFLKEQLEKNLPGLTVELQSMPFKQKLELETKMDYDFSFAGWGPDYADPMTFLDMFITKGGHNQMGYSNSDYDKIIKSAKGKLALEPEKRWEELQKAEKILIEEDQAISPLYQRGLAFLQDPKVKNIYDHKFGGDYSYKWVYIAK